MSDASISIFFQTNGNQPNSSLILGCLIGFRICYVFKFSLDSRYCSIGCRGMGNNMQQSFFILNPYISKSLTTSESVVARVDNPKYAHMNEVQQNRLHLIKYRLGELRGIYELRLTESDN